MCRCSPPCWHRGGRQGASVAPGAVIEYVICLDAAKGSVAERAYHPKTVLKAEGMLQIDTAWYLSQQIHPPIWRLCEPIDGLDSAQVAECLGLDPAKFQTYAAYAHPHPHPDPPPAPEA
jgi:DNA polymerase alpha subunit A